MTDAVPETSISNPLESAREAAARGNFSEAERLYRKCLSENMDDPDIQRELGILYANKKRYPEAVELLQKATAASPEAFAFLALADSFIGLLQWADAEAVLSRVLQSLPKFGPAVRRLARLAVLRGEADQALHLSRLAAEYAPDDLESLFAYAGMLSARDSAEAVAVFRAQEAIFIANPRLKADWAAFLLHLQERAGREANGLPATWCTDADDIDMRFCFSEMSLLEASAQALAVAAPHDRQAHTYLGHIAVHRGQNQAAHTHFAAARGDEPSIVEMVTFDPEFYRDMEGSAWEGLIRELPPVVHIARPKQSADHCIFLACDAVYYFRYAKALLRSINAVAPGSDAQLHIMDATAEAIADVQAFAAELKNIALGVSTETTPFGKGGDGTPYYGAMRFVRLYQAWEGRNQTVLMMDVDGLVHRNPWPGIAEFPSFDIAFRVYPAALEVWNRFLAGVVIYRPTAMARKYARMVSAFIVKSFFENKLRWGIDQFALYAVYSFLRDAQQSPRLMPLNDGLASLDALPEALIWLQAGRSKEFVRRYARSGLSSAGIAQSQYVEALRVYSQNAK